MRNVLYVKTNATLGGSPMTLSAFDYGVNDLGQRDDVDVSGTAFVAPYTRGFKYDAKGQVVRDDHSADDAKDRAFAFDGIGNRTKSADSLMLPASNNYATNALNQYSTALGISRPAASHDDDGNLVDDGVKTYVWDGENRLLSVSLHGGQADSSGVLVSYTYDYLSRRISKNETSGLNVTFIYDGWNPVAVYGGAGLSKTYTWGMDLSGSMQGAGGVGGLLAVKEASGGDSYYPTYDGNGNVSEYLDSTGAVVAHYEYDAFGRTTVSSGVMKDDFVHRFSTKQWDGASGLYYYGYRYYDPKIGRWPSRDRIEEAGGLNLYAFVNNDGVNYLDYLGLEAITVDLGNIRGLGNTGNNHVKADVTVTGNCNGTLNKPTVVISGAQNDHENFHPGAGKGKFTADWKKKWGVVKDENGATIEFQSKPIVTIKDDTKTITWNIVRVKSYTYVLNQERKLVQKVNDSGKMEWVIDPTSKDRKYKLSSSLSNPFTVKVTCPCKDEEEDKKGE